MRTHPQKKSARDQSGLTKILAGVAFVLAIPLTASATEYRTINHPRQECWNEQVAQPGAGGYGGAIVGGLTGGLLGNQIGRGNGRVAATAVGAATGAVVGDRISGSSECCTSGSCFNGAVASLINLMARKMKPKPTNTCPR